MVNTENFDMIRWRAFTSDHSSCLTPGLNPWPSKSTVTQHSNHYAKSWVFMS